MNARYLFEHQFLPQCLFSEDHRDRFLLNLLNGKEDFLLRALNNLSKKLMEIVPIQKMIFLFIQYSRKEKKAVRTYI